MMDALLQQLIDLVKQTAPQLWAIALKQVYANVARDVILAAVLVVVAYLCYVSVKRAASLETDEESIFWSDSDFCGFVITIGSIAFLVCCVVIVANLVSVVQSLVNPEYYAIQILMGLVK